MRELGMHLMHKFVNLRYTSHGIRWLWLNVSFFLKTAALRKRFLETIQRYQDVERLYDQKYRQRVERQIRIGIYKGVMSENEALNLLCSKAKCYTRRSRSLYRLGWFSPSVCPIGRWKMMIKSFTFCSLYSYSWCMPLGQTKQEQYYQKYKHAMMTLSTLKRPYW